MNLWRDFSFCPFSFCVVCVCASIILSFIYFAFLFCMCILFIRAILHFTVRSFICSPMFGHSFSSVPVNAYCGLCVYLCRHGIQYLYIVSFTLCFSVQSSMRVIHTTRYFMCMLRYLSPVLMKTTKKFSYFQYRVSLDCIISIT